MMVASPYMGLLPDGAWAFRYRWWFSEAIPLRRIPTPTMKTTSDRTTDEQCICDNPRQFQLRRLLIHGIVIRCESCDGIYHRVENSEVFNPILDELPLSGHGELTLTLDETVLAQNND